MLARTWARLPVSEAVRADLLATAPEARHRHAALKAAALEALLGPERPAALASRVKRAASREGGGGERL